MRPNYLFFIGYLIKKKDKISKANPSCTYESWIRSFGFPIVQEIIHSIKRVVYIMYIHIHVQRDNQYHSCYVRKTAISFDSILSFDCIVRLHSSIVDGKIGSNIHVYIYISLSFSLSLSLSLSFLILQSGRLTILTSNFHLTKNNFTSETTMAHFESN